jgi:hypothetical protein
MASSKDGLIKFIKNDVFDSDDSSTDLKAVALRILTHLVCCEEEFKQMEYVNQIEANATFRAGDNFKYLLNVNFNCIDSQGQSFAGLEIEDEEDQALYYESCANSALLLTRLQIFGETISVAHWQKLAWAMISPNRTMRKRLMDTLSNIIRLNFIHFKFLALPCLFAGDTELCETAQHSLTFAIRRLRRTNEEINTKLVKEKDENVRSQLKQQASLSVSEMILPYLLHLLTYHPDFPESVTLEGDDAKKMKSIMQSINMLLTAFQTTLKDETSNLPLLFKQLNTISSKFADKLDRDNIGVHFISNLTLRVLNDQVKTADNMQVYPGEISLPSDLYQPLAPEEALQIQQLNSTMLGKNINLMNNATAKNKRQLSSVMSPKKPSKAQGNRASPGDRRQSEETISKKAEKKKAKKTLPEEVPERVLPRRSAKAVQSYAEPDVDEREVEKWNENAMRKSSSFRRSSASFTSLSESRRSIGNDEKEVSKSRISLGRKSFDELDLSQQDDSSPKSRKSSLNESHSSLDDSQLSLFGRKRKLSTSRTSSSSSSASAEKAKRPSISSVSVGKEEGVELNDIDAPRSKKVS